MYNIQYTIYNIQYTIYNIQYTYIYIHTYPSIQNCPMFPASEVWPLLVFGALHGARAGAKRSMKSAQSLAAWYGSPTQLEVSGKSWGFWDEKLGWFYKFWDRKMDHPTDQLGLISGWFFTARLRSNGLVCPCPICPSGIYVDKKTHIFFIYIHLFISLVSYSLIYIHTYKYICILYIYIYIYTYIYIFYMVFQWNKPSSMLLKCCNHANSIAEPRGPSSRRRVVLRRGQVAMSAAQGMEVYSWFMAGWLEDFHV